MEGGGCGVVVVVGGGLFDGIFTEFTEISFVVISVSFCFFSPKMVHGHWDWQTTE